MLQLDMHKVLAEFVSFDSISHGCIYQNDRILESTFPSVIKNKLVDIGRALDKIFVSSEAIDQGHDEIHFELEQHFLIVYRVNNDFLLILLTAKDINLSLVYMTIKSIEKSIRLHGPKPSDDKRPQSNFFSDGKAHDGKADDGKADDGKEHDGKAHDVKAHDGKEKVVAPRNQTTDSNQLKSKLVKLKKLLLDSFGPVATIIFEESARQWKGAHTPKTSNLDKLVELISLQIDDKDERRLFFTKATKILRSSSELPK